MRTDEVAGCAIVFIYIAGIVALITAIVSDAMHSRIAWVLVDIFVFPIGVVRGFLILFGVI
jgi:hypothetical protein